MRAVKLELRCPQFVGEVAIDPQPDWSFTTLLSELSSIEKRLSAVDFTKAKPGEVSSAAFVMRVMDDLEEESEEETHDQHLVSGRRFNCEEFYISDSDDSEEESTSGTQYHLMDRVGLVESSLSELTHEYQLSVTEEIRNQILVLETDLVNENKKFASALAQVQKCMEGRLEMDRKLDMQYKRRIAEALDNHLTAVQRDHEHKSQVEERRIRDDAAIEEAKRREKTLQEEKLRQEKLRAEAEVRLEAEKKRAEEAKAAAAEAARKAAKEAAETVAAEDSARAASTAAVATKEAIRHQTDANLGILNDESYESGPGGTRNIIRCAESALKLEERRAQIHKEVAAKNEALGLGSSSIHLSHGSKIQRLIKQTSGSKENVRNKADELSKIFFDSSCPQSISIAMFAEKIIDLCVSPNNAFFAYAHVIVLVTSQVPLAMDLLLAKLNRVCIYTVPKYINYSKSAFATKEAHHKAIGYKEDDGEIESQESYISRMESYMRLYGALVQTEVPGIQNSHGLGEGWAWLARFLNALPANLYTAVALQAFLDMAGFALHRRYKTHFKKLLRIILRDIVNPLKQREGDRKFNRVITSIQTYIESEKFLEEPEGRSLQGSLLSHSCVLESNAEQSYHQHPSSRYFYQY